MFGYLSERKPNPCLRVWDDIVFKGNLDVGKEGFSIKY